MGKKEVRNESNEVKAITMNNQKKYSTKEHIEYIVSYFKLDFHFMKLASITKLWCNNSEELIHVILNASVKILPISNPQDKF